MTIDDEWAVEQMAMKYTEIHNHFCRLAYEAARFGYQSIKVDLDTLTGPDDDELVGA